MKKVLIIPNLIRLSLLMTLIFPFIWLTACEDQGKLTPDTKDSTQTDPCKKNHTGDWCFKNSLSNQITIQMSDPGRTRQISVQSGEIGFFYDLTSGRHTYDFFAPVGSGEIRVIECKSDTTEIK